MKSIKKSVGRRTSVQVHSGGESHEEGRTGPVSSGEIFFLQMANQLLEWLYNHRLTTTGKKIFHENMLYFGRTGNQKCK